MEAKSEVLVAHPATHPVLIPSSLPAFGGVELLAIPHGFDFSLPCLDLISIY